MNADTKPDHAAALATAKYVIDPDTSEDINNLAAAYLELTAQLEAWDAYSEDLDECRAKLEAERKAREAESANYVSAFTALKKAAEAALAAAPHCNCFCYHCSLGRHDECEYGCAAAPPTHLQQAVLDAAIEFVPYWTEGWDEYDDLTDQEAAHTAGDALASAVKNLRATVMQSAAPASQYADGLERAELERLVGERVGSRGK